MQISIKFMLTILISIAGITATAADYKATITHRQGIYTIMAGHMKVLKSILLMGHPGISDVNFHAKGIREATLHHGKAFPKGSDKGKTAALSSIWENPDAFKQAGLKFRESLQEFIEVSESDDITIIQNSFKKVNKACKGCHDDFRQKK